MSDEFVDAYAISTGRKQRIPRDWLDDPIQGPKFAKTPSQRELDGDLGPRPRQDTSVKDVDQFAEDAGIDLTGAKDKTAKLVAIEAAFDPAEVQGGMVPVDPAPPIADPLAPELVAHVDVTGPAVESADEEAPEDSPDGGDKP